MSPRRFKSAHIHDRGLGSLSFDLQRRNERVFSVNDNSIRVPFDFNSDSELPGHCLAFLRLGCERALTGMDHALRASLSLLVPGRCRVVVHSARTPNALNREWGGRWFYGHHMLHGPPHGALHVLASVNNGAPLTDGNSVTPAQVTLIKVKEESVDLTILAGSSCALLG